MHACVHTPPGPDSADRPQRLRMAQRLARLPVCGRAAGGDLPRGRGRGIYIYEDIYMHAHVHAMPVCGRAAGGDLPFAPCSFEPRWRKRPSERLVGPVRISQQAPPPPRVPCTLHPVPTPPRVRGHLASDDVAHVGAKREQPRETRLHTCMYAYVHDAHACACMHMCMYAYVHVYGAHRSPS